MPTQVAPLRFPTLEECYALLPGGPASPVLGPPPGAEVVWPEPFTAWPLLRVEPTVPVGTRYFFTLDQLVADEILGALSSMSAFSRPISSVRDGC